MWFASIISGLKTWKICNTGAVKARKVKDAAGNEGKVICVIKVLKTTWNDDCYLKDCYKPSSRHKL